MNRRAILWMTIAMILCVSSDATSQSEMCKTFPAYLAERGFDPKKTYFSTSEKYKSGILAIMSDKPGDPEAEIIDDYQHPTWTSAGYLGAITTIETGQSFVLPTPRITTLYNPPDQQNTVLVIDPVTGILSPFVRIPVEKMPNEKNPFGLTGMDYDCQTHHLLVSTISGSGHDSETGRIYRIDTRTRSVALLLDSIDVLGVGLFAGDGKKFLYLGRARTPHLDMVELNERNEVVSPLTRVFSIAGIGNRGDDRIKKVRFNDQGEMILTAFPFYYNLSAPSEFQHSEITLVRNKGQWQIRTIK